MEARRQDLMNSIGLLILRLVAGGFLISHGWGKGQMLLAGDFDKFPDPIGLGSGLSLVLVVAAEVICSVLVMIGFATRFAAAPIVFAMGVAAFVVHTEDPWTLAGGFPSKEPALLYLTAFLTLIFTGAGKLSVDGLIWPRLRLRAERQRGRGTKGQSGRGTEGQSGRGTKGQSGRGTEGQSGRGTKGQSSDL